MIHRDKYIQEILYELRKVSVEPQEPGTGVLIIPSDKVEKIITKILSGPPYESECGDGCKVTLDRGGYGTFAKLSFEDYVDDFDFTITELEALRDNIDSYIENVGEEDV